MRLFNLKNWVKLAAFGSCSLLMFSNAHATTWTYLSGVPDASVCSAVNSGSALLVVGVEGCTETAPWAGFTNLSGSPTYHGSDLDKATIATQIDKWSGMAPNSGTAWENSWSATGVYSKVSQVYVYLSPSNQDSGYCGIAAGQISTWPDLYYKNTAQHVDFPWAQTSKAPQKAEANR